VTNINNDRWKSNKKRKCLKEKAGVFSGGSFWSYFTLKRLFKKTDQSE